jgi:signal transduction histidine kinase
MWGEGGSPGIPPGIEVPARLDIGREIRRIVAVVVVTLRAATLLMAGFAAVSEFRAGLVASPWAAALIYLGVAVWSLVFAALVVRRDRLPAWPVVADVLVIAVAVAVLPRALRSHGLTAVVNPDLEPLAVAVAVSLGMTGGAPLAVLAGVAIVALAYAVAYPGMGIDGAPMAAASALAWQIGAAMCCHLFMRRLRAFSGWVDVATGQLVAAREKVAVERAYADERIRQFRERVRRHRVLHDGPLRLLVALAGTGPASHPDALVRRECAVNANILRGITPDEDGATLTDLSLALIEASRGSVSQGLLVDYQFTGLPEDLPPDVVTAFAGAAAEALMNVLRHAGTSRARLTAYGDGRKRSGVAVAVVDQGAGFDPVGTPQGFGLRHSVIARMTEVGGNAVVDSLPGAGTRVDLRWPA